MNLTRSQVGALERYAMLLEDRGRAFGVISARDQSRIRQRHVFDCARGVDAVQTGDAIGYDLGSGGGLPGIVVAVGCPGLAMTLVEVRARRVAFLEWVVKELCLPNVTVRHGRAESMPRGADVCFARALAPLPAAWELALPLLREGGRLAYFAGASADVPAAIDGASAVRTVPNHLETGGPLVIITR